MFKESETTIYEMPFPREVLLEKIEKQTECAICGSTFGADNPPHGHSLTGLHIVAGFVTWTHKGFQSLLGRFLGHGLVEDDCVLLCLKCHKELHRMADLASKERGFKGKATPPAILKEVTEFMVGRKRW